MSTDAKVSEVRFLSDNPFRAMGIGSSDSLADLRRKADRVAKAAQVGLKPDVPLIDLVGTSPFEQLPNLIRGLTSDSQRMTCYRIMWPLAQSSIDLLRPHYRQSLTELPHEEQVQVHFLSAWLSYLGSGSPTDAADTFEQWEELTRCEAFRDRLTQLLTMDGESDMVNAHDSVIKAQRTIAMAILERVSAEAASYWNTGQTSIGAQLLEAILNSPIDDELEEKALEPIANAAHLLEEKIEAAIEDLSQWRRGSPTDPPRDVIQLERIAGMLQGRLPSASDWEATARRWTTVLVWRMRQESLRLHQADDNTGALDVIRAALKLANTENQQAKLSQDLVALEEIVSNEMKEAAFAGIERINKAPSLHTINGFGTTVYGRVPLQKDNQFYFTILYFTALFIPIFPISRYLVKDGDSGGWHFLGKSPWTTGMKWHLGVSCSLIAALCFYFLSDSSDLGKTVNQMSSSPSSAKANSGELESGQPDRVDQTAVNRVSTPKKVSNDSRKSSSKSSQVEQRSNIDYTKWLADQASKGKRREQMQAELATLKSEIEELESRIDAEESNLAFLRSELETIKEQIDASDPDPYSQFEIDSHNEQVRLYERLRAQYNDKVKEFNRSISLSKAKVNKHNRIVNELNAGN